VISEYFFFKNRKRYFIYIYIYIRKIGSKPWLYPAPSYRSLETYWDTKEDAPGPRCGHTLTAVAASKSHGPRLILFGGATAIEGGASSSAPGIS
jgi:protein phosphatase